MKAIHCEQILEFSLGGETFNLQRAANSENPTASESNNVVVFATTSEIQNEVWAEITWETYKILSEGEMMQ